MACDGVPCPVKLTARFVDVQPNHRLHCAYYKRLICSDVLYLEVVQPRQPSSILLVLTVVTLYYPDCRQNGFRKPVHWAYDEQHEPCDTVEVYRLVSMMVCHTKLGRLLWSYCDGAYPYDCNLVCNLACFAEIPGSCALFTCCRDVRVQKHLQRVRHKSASVQPAELNCRLVHSLSAFALQFVSNTGCLWLWR